MTQRLFITDCEGPVSKNDNAFELAQHYIPHGADFFSRISRYDDILADILKRPGYKAGDTLKLILPFLKAYGATDAALRAFSQKSLRLIPDVNATLSAIAQIMPSYIISTSYQHYIQALCDTIHFPFDHTYSTLVTLDRYHLSPREETLLHQWCSEVVEMPLLPTTPKAWKGEEKHIIEKLDRIFFTDIPRLDCGRILVDVDPVGGERKAEAVNELVTAHACTLSDVIYVGDSITDTAPLKQVREGGGITVSFNGNVYALREAEIAVISGSSIPTAALACLFSKGGRRHLIDTVSAGNEMTLQQALPPSLRDKLKKYRSEVPLEVTILSGENRMKLVQKSEQARRTVRGESIASLG